MANTDLNPNKTKKKFISIAKLPKSYIFNKNKE